MPVLALLPRPGHPGRAVTVNVEVGTSVLDAAQAVGVLIPTRCGGVRACRACQVETDGAGLSVMEDDEDAALRAEGAPLGRRLACQARVTDDASVHVLPPHEIDG